MTEGLGGGGSSAANKILVSRNIYHSRSRK